MRTQHQLNYTKHHYKREAEETKGTEGTEEERCVKRRKLDFTGLYTNEEIEKKKQLKKKLDKFEQDARSRFERALCFETHAIYNQYSKLYDAKINLNAARDGQNLNLPESTKYNRECEFLSFIIFTSEVLTKYLTCANTVHALNSTCKSLYKVNYAGLFWKRLKHCYESNKKIRKEHYNPLSLTIRKHMPHLAIFKVAVCKYCHGCLIVLSNGSRAINTLAYKACPLCKESDDHLVYLSRNVNFNKTPAMVVRKLSSDLSKSNCLDKIFIRPNLSQVNRFLETVGKSSIVS